MILPEHIAKLTRTFMPYATAERERMVLAKGRLAYYTNAETALKIIQNEELWLRDSRCMNDYAEVRGGTKLVADYFLGDSRLKSITGLFNSFGHGGSLKRGIDLYKKASDSAPRGTYLTSLSCHAVTDQNEDRYGRLSMWRAYGRGSGVALVFRPIEPDRPNDAQVLLSPVAYIDRIEAEAERVLESIGAERDFLSTMPSDAIMHAVYAMLMMASVSIKHPGFLEEQEWRLLHIPAFIRSPVMIPATETINGIPQKVFKFRLPLMRESGLPRFDLNAFIDRIIIGPTQFPDTIAEALISALQQKGVENPSGRIVMSNIPVRV